MVDKEGHFLFSVEVKGVGEGGKERSERSESTAVKIFCASKCLGGEFKSSESIWSFLTMCSMSVKL